MQTLESKSLLSSTVSLPTVDARPAGGKHPCKQERGLIYVGVFKLLKALFFLALGVGALHLIHRDIGDLLMRVVRALPIDPEGHFVSVLMDKADLIGGHQLRQIGMGTFAYATLCTVEGVGLILRKSWAEYVTVVLTTLALPWEIYELVERFTMVRVGVLISNLLILAYLLWLLRRKRSQAAASA